MCYRLTQFSGLHTGRTETKYQSNTSTFSVNTIGISVDLPGGGWRGFYLNNLKLTVVCV